MEGDIAAVCRKEMDAVLAAAFILSQPLRPQQQQLARPPVPDAEEKRAIVERTMSEVFHAKKIGE
jgi:hypothetical protein